MKILFEMYFGSRLYGLETENSDTDIVGVYIEDTFEEFINPFKGKKSGEIDMSIISKQENGKNDKDAVDKKYYHLNKFIKLCSDMNPNILEMLFANEENIIYVDPMFKEHILYNYMIFMSTKYKATFKGYAINCKHKSITNEGKDYNPKMTHHFVRLLEEGRQIAEKGKLDFPFRGFLKYALINIKNKVFSLETIEKLINEYEKIEYEEKVKYNDEPDYDEIKKKYNTLISYYYGLKW